jgi:3-dehydroquinate dehydratase-1
MLRLGTLELGRKPLIAVPLTDVEVRVQTAEALAFADILELRIDLFENQEPDHVATICAEARSAGAPLIATVRSTREGGGTQMPDDERQRLFETAIPDVDAVDIELRSSLRGCIVDRIHQNGKLAIVSHHDLRGTPATEQLSAIVDSARSAGADIVKIATQANTSNDRNRLLELLLQRREEALIIIAMGPLGAASRVFFPLCGSLITYGFLNESVAPGQLSIRDLRSELQRYGSQV